MAQATGVPLPWSSSRIGATDPTISLELGQRQRHFKAAPLNVAPVNVAPNADGEKARPIAP